MRDQQDNKQDNQLDERKPGTFSKGDPRINRAGPPRKVDADPVAPQLLRDLRHVYNRAKSADKTQGQRMLRKMFEREPEKFVYRLQKAEAEFRAMPRPEAVEPQEEVDQGTANSLALLENLLIQHEAERIAEDAAFAKRPDAAQIGATLQYKLTAALEREAMLRKQIDELRGQRHG
jgi:hypothetical protein